MAFAALIHPPTALEKLVPEINSWLAEHTPAENAHVIFANGPNGQVGFPGTNQARVLV
jgi:hypothetical protein